MTTQEALHQLAHAGDEIAGMLGVAAAAMEDDDPFRPDEIDRVRAQIRRWHRIRQIAAETDDR